VAWARARARRVFGLGLGLPRQRPVIVRHLWTRARALRRRTLSIEVGSGVSAAMATSVAVPVVTPWARPSSPGFAHALARRRPQPAPSQLHAAFLPLRASWGWRWGGSAPPGRSVSLVRQRARSRPASRAAAVIRASSDFNTGDIMSKVPCHACAQRSRGCCGRGADVLTHQTPSSKTRVDGDRPFRLGGDGARLEHRTGGPVVCTLQ